MLFSESVGSAALEKALSATWQKTQVVVHNISNEDTPGYKAKRVEFDSLLRRELGQTGMKYSTMSKSERIDRIKSVQPVVYSDESTEGRIDGNNVDIVSEQVELARLQIQYQALRDRINGHYNTLKYAISGGR